MASATSPCIYKTVPLLVGETFTLPPGAEIISSSGGLQAITSTCPLPKDLETPVCYVFMYAQVYKAGNKTPPYDDVYMTGIRVNGVSYPFANWLDTDASVSQWNSAINSTPFAGVILFKNGISHSRSGAGMTAKFSFQTIPSIGDNLYIIGYATGQTNGPTTGNIQLEHKAYLSTSAPDGGEEGWPGC